MLTITTATGQTLMQFDRINKTYSYNQAHAPNRFILIGLSRIATPPYAGYQGRTVATLPSVQGPSASEDSYLAYWHALKYYYLHVLSKGGFGLVETLPVTSAPDAKSKEEKHRG